MAALTALALGAGALQSGVGLAQYFSARNELKDLQKTEYEIPQAATDLMSNAQNRIVGGLDSEIQRRYSENLLSGQANALNQLSDRKGGLMGVTQADATATSGMNQILSLDVQERIRNQQLKDAAVERARMEMISQQETVYQEQRAKEIDRENQLLADKGAGMQNFMGGIGQVGKAGILGGANAGVTGKSIMMNNLGYGADTPSGTTYGFNELGQEQSFAPGHKKGLTF